MTDALKIAQAVMGGIIMPVAFMSGLWNQVGVDPEEEAVEGIAITLYEAFENPMMLDILSTYYTIAVLSFIVAMVAVTVIARIPGFIAFWLAYFGGYILILVPEIGLLSLLASWGLVVIGVLIAGNNSRSASSRYY